jgi:hypothetical protein
VKDGETRLNTMGIKKYGQEMARQWRVEEDSIVRRSPQREKEEERWI